MPKIYILKYALVICLVGCATTAPTSKPVQSQAACEIPADLINRASVEAPLNGAVYERTTSLRQVQKQAEDLAKTQSVLVVFDIDDTLLTNKPASELGSTTWYNWQSALLGGGAVDPCSAAKGPNSFNELFDIIDLSYVLLDLIPTEEGAADVLSSLKQTGISTHALTARSPKYIGATLRELDDNGMSFHAQQSTQPAALPPCESGTCMDTGIVSHLATERLMVDIFGCEALIGGKTKLSSFTAGKSCDGYTKPRAPYATNKVFDRGRETVISNGVMSVEGQNKGLMLEYLLQSFGAARFEHVIFVDDSPGNIAKISAVKALNAPDSRLNSTDLTLYYYDQFDAHTKFLGSADELHRAKKQLDALVCTAKLFGQITDSMGRSCKHTRK